MLHLKCNNIIKLQCALESCSGLHVHSSAGGSCTARLTVHLASQPVSPSTTFAYPSNTPSKLCFMMIKNGKFFTTGLCSELASHHCSSSVRAGRASTGAGSAACQGLTSPTAPSKYMIVVSGQKMTRLRSGLCNHQTNLACCAFTC